MGDINFWLLSAGKDGELWPAFWRKNKIAIGWSELGNLKNFSSRNELWSKYKEIFSKDKSGAQRTGVMQVWNFCKEMKLNDVVFVRSYGALIGIALVNGEYEFIEEQDPLRKEFYSPYFDDFFPHTRSVRWISLGGGMKQPLTLTRLAVKVSSEM